MKRIKLTHKGEELLEVLNEKIFEHETEYDELSMKEQILNDLGMYIDECYTERVFDTMDEFIKENADGEYGETTPEVLSRVKQKIDWGIEHGYVTIESI